MKKSIILLLILVMTLELYSTNKEAERYYNISKEHFDQIKDPSSWMKHAKSHEINLKLCLELDPDKTKYRLLAAKSMLSFPSAMGSEQDGERLLYTLEEKEPNNVDILITLSNYLLDKNRTNEAKTKLESILLIEGDHIEANDLYNEILLAEKELTIRDFLLVDDIKTSNKRIINKVSSFIGKTYNNRVKVQIKERLTQISPIEDVDFELKEVDGKYVDIVLIPDEDNMKGLVYIADSTIALDYDKDIVPDGIPAVMYMDENLFGLGINLEFLTAVVFNKLDLKIPGLIDDRFIDLKLSIETMLMPTSNDYYYNGKQLDKTEEHTYVKGSLSLGKSFDFGLQTFINYGTEYNIYKDVKDAIEPSGYFTNTLDLSIEFTTAEDIFSPLQVKNGYNISINPIMIYKPNFKPWGKKRDLNKHNSNPAYGLTASLGYYKSFRDRHNISVDLNLMYLSNNYESTKYRLGQKAITDEYSLVGYIPKEIGTDFGLLSNVKYSLSIVPDRFLLFGKYDLLCDIDNDKLFNGIAAGFALKLPWDIHMSSEFGIGLDAKRDSGFGYSGSITLSKVVLF